MEKVLDAAGRDEAEMFEQGGRGAVSTCIGVLAAINLAVLMVVTQLPITRPGIERLVLAGDNGQARLFVGDGAGRRAFQGCAGGGSVNCHRNGCLSRIQPARIPD